MRPRPRSRPPSRRAAPGRARRAARSSGSPHRPHRAARAGRFDAVIHFAGRKAVGESVDFPMLYYTHNVVGAVNLVEVMRKHGVKNVRPWPARCAAGCRRRGGRLRSVRGSCASHSARCGRGRQSAPQAAAPPALDARPAPVPARAALLAIGLHPVPYTLSHKPRASARRARRAQIVFSSSCTVYGNPTKVPIDEGHPLKALSPYGRSKLIIEDMFRDVAASPKESGWRIILLRYFNPVGAHPSGAAPARAAAAPGVALAPRAASAASPARPLGCPSEPTLCRVAYASTLSTRAAAAASRACAVQPCLGDARRAPAPAVHAAHAAARHAARPAGGRG